MSKFNWRKILSSFVGSGPVQPNKYTYEHNARINDFCKKSPVRMTLVVGRVNVTQGKQTIYTQIPYQCKHGKSIWLGPQRYLRYQLKRANSVGCSLTHVPPVTNVQLHRWFVIHDVRWTENTGYVWQMTDMKGYYIKTSLLRIHLKPYSR